MARGRIGLTGWVVRRVAVRRWSCRRPSLNIMMGSSRATRSMISKQFLSASFGAWKKSLLSRRSPYNLPRRHRPNRCFSRRFRRRINSCSRLRSYRPATVLTAPWTASSTICRHAKRSLIRQHTCLRIRGSHFSAPGQSFPTCLTADQISAVKQINQGPRTTLGGTITAPAGAAAHNHPDNTGSWLCV